MELPRRSGRSDSTESHITLEELVALSRPQDDGGRVQDHDRTPGEGVARDAFQEDGKLLHKCQSLTCGSEDQARRYVDLVPVVFTSKNGVWIHKGWKRGMLDGAQR